MIISSHHILYDGWSNGIILIELFNAYNALWWGDEPLQLPAKTKFKEYVQWISEQDTGRQKKYWTVYLKGIERGTQFPIKKNKKKQEQLGSQQKAETYQVILPTKVNKRLDLFTRKYKVTTASVLYSAWGVLLQKYTNNDDVLFGTTVSGRSANIKDIETIVGLFINTLPLRVTTHDCETDISLICRIK